jgi:zinc transport system substrate-binding protein
MRLILFLICLPLCLQTAAVLAAPRVVTSITALQEITATLMEGVGIPQSIIADGASMHHFAFRPSHMRLLQQADLVVWVDRHFEAGFQRVAETLPRTTAQLELLPALGIDSDDGHIWYSPARLQQLITIITAHLIELDPDNLARYHDNAQQLSAAIDAWRADTIAEISPQQPRFITDHEFTSHLQADMGYAAIATIHDQHDGHSGLRELGQIEQRLRQQPASCLLTLESPAAPLALELAQKYHLKVITLVPAVTDDPKLPAIILRLQGLESALRECS